MRVDQALAGIAGLALAAFAAQGPALAYQGLEADYQVCTQGAGKVTNARIVQACTRLIDNAATKNEIVGFFHALRASANTDRAQNCADGRIAKDLLTGADMKAQAQKLIDANCDGASAPAGTPQACMTANEGDQIAEGELAIGEFQDAAGRPETAYILQLAEPVCLSSSEPDERVESTSRIHIFSSNDEVHAAIYGFVGKTVQVRGEALAAHTAHHHAPILMDITEIDEN